MLKSKRIANHLVVTATLAAAITCWLNRAPDRFDLSTKRVQLNRPSVTPMKWQDDTSSPYGPGYGHISSGRVYGYRSLPAANPPASPIGLPSVVPPSPNSEPADDWHFAGYIEAGGRRGAQMVNAVTGEKTTVWEGDHWQGGVVTSIGPNGLTMSGGDESQYAQVNADSPQLSAQIDNSVDMAVTNVLTEERLNQAEVLTQTIQRLKYTEVLTDYITFVDTKAKDDAAFEEKDKLIKAYQSRLTTSSGRSFN